MKTQEILENSRKIVDTEEALLSIKNSDQDTYLIKIAGVSIFLDNSQAHRIIEFLLNIRSDAAAKLIEHSQEFILSKHSNGAG